MTDCLQPFEMVHRVTLQTIEELNQYGIGYLIVTKSAMIAAPEYLSALDQRLAHVQITVTCLDDKKTLQYEKASPPSQRIKAILALQAAGVDVALRLSPIIEEYIDFHALNALGVEKCVIEFLRINSWIKQWFQGADFSQYTLRHGGYYHLPLEEKVRAVDKIHLPVKTVCEDVTDHYLYWRQNINPNPKDCCNLRLTP